MAPKSEPPVATWSQCETRWYGAGKGHELAETAYWCKAKRAAAAYSQGQLSTAIDRCAPRLHGALCPRWLNLVPGRNLCHSLGAFTHMPRYHHTM